MAHAAYGLGMASVPATFGNAEHAEKAMAALFHSRRAVRRRQGQGNAAVAHY